MNPPVLQRQTSKPLISYIDDDDDDDDDYDDDGLPANMMIRVTAFM